MGSTLPANWVVGSSSPRKFGGMTAGDRPLPLRTLFENVGPAMSRAMPEFEAT